MAAMICGIPLPLAFGARRRTRSHAKKKQPGAIMKIIQRCQWGIAPKLNSNKLKSFVYPTATRPTSNDAIQNGRGLENSRFKVIVSK